MDDKITPKFTIKLIVNIILSISLVFIVIGSWILINIEVIKYAVVLVCIYVLASLIYRDFKMIKNREEEILHLESKIKKIRYEKRKNENKISGFKKRIRELKNDNNLLKEKIKKIREEVKNKDMEIRELKDNQKSKLEKTKRIFQKNTNQNTA